METIESLWPLFIADDDNATALMADIELVYDDVEVSRERLKMIFAGPAVLTGTIVLNVSEDPEVWQGMRVGTIWLNEFDQFEWNIENDYEGDEYKQFI